MNRLLNRLWVRLTLALGLVTLVGVGMVALLTNIQAAEQFRQYVAGQDIANYSSLLDSIQAFYAKNGTWQGVSDVMAKFIAARSQVAGRGRAPLVLADVNGVVVYDEDNARVGAALSSDERVDALPVSVNSQTVGYLVVRPPWRNVPGAIEQNFLTRLRFTLLIAAGAAGLLSLVLAVVLSRTLTAPLASLEQGARFFAARAWDHRVPEKGTAEVADAARAFNEMAASLQEAESLRRNLMADIAHELRTPLTVLQGNLRAMLDGVYPLERSEIATLYDETRLLGRLVDDLRELALAEAGQLPLNLQATDLSPLLTTVASNFGVAAETKAVQINEVVAEPLPPVRADADRVRQVLVNLMSNALYHTPEGAQITLSAAVRDGRVQVAVTDTGEGITPKDLPHVFDRFYRGDSSRSRGHGGAGLGLAIAKAWVQALGGEIGVESSPGHGSRFWFTLALA